VKLAVVCVSLVFVAACATKTTSTSSTAAPRPVETAPALVGTWSIHATTTALTHFPDETVGHVSDSTWKIESTCSSGACDFAQFVPGNNAKPRLYKYEHNNRWTYDETGQADCHLGARVAKNAYKQVLEIEITVTKSQPVASGLRATEFTGKAVLTDTPSGDAGKGCPEGRAEHSLRGVRTA
jgi:hypothetical protein